MESDCPGIAVGDSFPDEPEMSINDGGCLLEDVSGLGVESVCEAGGDIVGARSRLDMSAGECHVSGEETILLHYDEATDALTGTSEFAVSVSGSCSEEVIEQFGNGCHALADVIGHPDEYYSVPYDRETPHFSEEPYDFSHFETEYYTEDTEGESPPSAEPEPAPEPAAGPEEELAPEEEAEPKPRPRLNPDMIDWFVRLCADVECEGGEFCFVGVCLERERFFP